MYTAAEINTCRTQTMNSILTDLSFTWPIFQPETAAVFIAKTIQAKHFTREYNGISIQLQSFLMPLIEKEANVYKPYYASDKIVCVNCFNVISLDKKLPILYVPSCDSCYDARLTTDRGFKPKVSRIPNSLSEYSSLDQQRIHNALINISGDSYVK